MRVKASVEGQEAASSAVAAVAPHPAARLTLREDRIPDGSRNAGQRDGTGAD